MFRPPRYDYTTGLYRFPQQRKVGVYKQPPRVPAALRRASMDPYSGISGSLGGNRQVYTPMYERAEAPTLVEDFLPTDIKTQNKIFRNILQYDAIAGPATEYWCSMAFSRNVILSDIDDPTVMHLYEDATTACGIIPEFPLLLHDYLTIGRFVFFMQPDKRLGYWVDHKVLDPDFVRIKVPPFRSMAPMIDWQPSSDERDWALSDDPRAMEQRATTDPMVLRAMIAGESVPLDHEDTVFLPRQQHATDQYGTSYLCRILPFKIYEKAIMDASIAGARRRAGPVWLATVPEDYTAGEISEIIDQMFAAEDDPVGGKLAFRNGVTLTEVGSKDSVVNIRDDWDFLTQAKMRALGLSENILTGETNFNTMDKILSAFLEKLRAVRELFTRRILTDKIYKTLAKRHKFIKRTQAELSHRIRISGKHHDESNLLLPTVEWDRPLEPTADRDYWDMLVQLEEKGIPVQIRKWAQAAGYDFKALLQNQKSELSDRAQIYGLRQALDKQRKQYGFDEEGGIGGGGAGFGGEAPGGLDLGGPETGGLGEPGGAGGGLDLGAEPLGGGGAGGTPAEPTAAPAASETTAPPPGGPAGAGASLLNPRFQVVGPPQRYRRASVYSAKPYDLEIEISKIPIWENDMTVASLPRRRVAQMVEDLVHQDPNDRQGREFYATMKRRHGFTNLQADVIQYCAARVGVVQAPTMAEESVDFLQRVLAAQAEKGLTPAVDRELDFLGHVAHRESQDIGFKNMTSRAVPADKLLTGLTE